MTRSEAVSFIKRKLGFRTDDREADIIDNLKAAQTLLEQGDILPWFLINNGKELELNEDTNEVSLPSDFIREYEHTSETRQGNVYYLDSDGEAKFLRKMEYLEMVEEYKGSDAGAPKAYAINGSNLEVQTDADQDYTLYFPYFFKDTVLDNNIENKWLANVPYLLIGEAGILMAQDLGNERIKSFQVLSQAGRAKMVAENYERFSAGRSYVLGRKRA